MQKSNNRLIDQAVDKWRNKNSFGPAKRDCKGSMGEDQKSIDY